MSETSSHESNIGSVGGPVHTGSGDINIYDFGEAYHELEAIVPEGNDALDRLTQSLHGFAGYHEVISEWKELHGLLQELLNDLSQFMMEVERLYSEGKVATREQLRPRWRPCERRVRRLIDFSKRVRHIGEKPFQQDKDGELHGPPWAVDIFQDGKMVREALDERDVDIDNLYEWANNLVVACDSYLYQADSNLRDKAGELCELSKGILARIGQ